MPSTKKSEVVLLPRKIGVVAIALALRHADTRHVAHHVGDVLHVLVVDQLDASPP